MKKVFLWIACITLFVTPLVCTGCSHGYTFMYEQSEITSVDIVSLPDGLHYTEALKEETVLCQIENVSIFLTDLSEMEFKSIHPPFDSSNPTTAIKITYGNGDCEWISPHGKTLLRNGSLTFNGTVSCDEAQFFAWIEPYIKN